MIRLDRVTKEYEEAGKQHLVLSGASATINTGDFAVLLGRSGSGKSTLLNLISGIDQPTGGEIWIDDVALTQLSEQRRTLLRRERIGFVFQFFNLIPTLTVLENVLLQLELGGKATPQSRQHGLDLLAEVGLADRIHTFPDRLSGGEQQRVAIARALAHNPSLVLADEPTGNLDADTGEQVLALLDRLTRQLGKTLFMVSHNPEVRQLANRVFFLREGQLVEEPRVPADGSLPSASPPAVRLVPAQVQGSREQR